MRPCRELKLSYAAVFCASCRALILAHRARCAAAILLRPAELNLRRAGPELRSCFTFVFELILARAQRCFIIIDKRRRAAALNVRRRLEVWLTVAGLRRLPLVTLLSASSAEIAFSMRLRCVRS